MDLAPDRARLTSRRRETIPTTGSMPPIPPPTGATCLAPRAVSFDAGNFTGNRGGYFYRRNRFGKFEKVYASVEDKRKRPGKTCGVYYLWDGAAVLYVGSSVWVEKRVAYHRRNGVIDFCGYFVDECKEEELKAREAAAIAEFKPPLQNPQQLIRQIGEEALTSVLGKSGFLPATSKPPKSGLSGVSKRAQ